MGIDLGEDAEDADAGDAYAGGVGGGAYRSAREANAGAFDQCLGVQRQALVINMQDWQLDNRGAEQWSAWAKEKVPAFLRRHNLQRRPDGFLVAREVNFASNCLGDLGILAVLRLLYTLRIGVRVMKLYKNNLGRAAACALMDWLAVTPVALLQLHLSHNYIPRVGCVDILKAIAFNPAYPPSPEHIGPTRRRVPLWLRLEQNLIERAAELLGTAEAPLRRILAASGRDAATGPGPLLCSGAGCRSDFCSQSEPEGHCPLAQVMYIGRQRDTLREWPPPEAKAWNEGRDPREEILRWAMVGAHAEDSGGSGSRRAQVREADSAPEAAASKGGHSAASGGAGAEGGAGGAGPGSRRGAPPSEAWSRYREPASSRIWFQNRETDEVFMEDVAGDSGWRVYMDDGRRWWWRDSDGAWFFEDSCDGAT